MSVSRLKWRAGSHFVWGLRNKAVGMNYMEPFWGTGGLLVGGGCAQPTERP